MAEFAPPQFGLTKSLIFRITLPHLCVVSITLAYLVVGAWILAGIEYSSDGAKEAVNQMEDAKLALANELWSSAQKAKLNGKPRLDEPMEEWDEHMAKFIDDLYGIYKQHPKLEVFTKGVEGIEPEVLGMHHFASKLFFAVTTLTSIGYGIQAPITMGNRIFVMAYIAVGIPLMLIMLADWAKFCTEAMNRFWTEVLKRKFYMGKRYKQMRYRARMSLRRRSSINVGEVRIAGGDEEIAEFLWTHLETTQFVEIPFAMVYAVLIGYFVLSAWIIAELENWSFGEGFYFILISVLTIGFGDLAPTRPNYVLISLCLIVFGLVITSTCIDVLGAYYINQLHFFGRGLHKDPLDWLKAVQEKRMLMMKQEAMKKLFECVAALNFLNLDPERFAANKKSIQDAIHKASVASAGALEDQISIPDPPNPPRNLHAYHASATSVFLRWDPPEFIEEGRRFWYTLTFRTRQTNKRSRRDVVMIDFITTCSYEVGPLKTFTMYEFILETSTKFGRSTPVRTQEYTEPCTVPQNLTLDAVSTETATISWQMPQKNKGKIEQYTLYFAQEPAPQFRYWSKYSIGTAKRFTITDLNPETAYLVCVSANHNSGLATVSKSLRFRTKTWWTEDDENDCGSIREIT